jgi:hypothetical protein
MARPRLDPDEQKAERLTVRFTVAERVFIEQQAQTAGVRTAELLRRRALSLPVQPRQARADAALISELNRIGNNVNQIARNLNAHRAERLDVGGVMTELRNVLTKLATAPLADEPDHHEGIGDDR